MKAYPQYKDSGVPWLGHVPKHWIFLKLRVILTSRTQRNRSDLPLLSVVREKGVIKRNVKNKEENHNTIPEDLSNYKIVESGQFVMNKMKAWQGSYSVSSYHGIVSPAYFVFDINHVYGCFFNYAIRSKAYIPFFTQASDGVRIGQWDLNKTRMKEIPFVVPPQDEQIPISRYLDWQTSKINKFIKAKKKLITLLKEQKQNIINEAVTKGINHGVKMKDSGVAWLGEIPEHWRIFKFKSFSKFYSGGTPNKSIDKFWTGNIPWVSPKDMKSKYIFDALDHISPEAVESSATCYIDENQLLMVVRSGILRRTIPVCITKNKVTFNQDIKAIVVNKKIISVEYLYELINGCEKNLLDQWLKVGATVESIEYEYMANCYLPVPPMKEQLLITDFLEKETALIDRTIARIEREIELIQEYRDRLISDVVTGKVDVRSVKIPDFDSVEMEQEVEGDEEAEDELITESIEE